MEAYRDYLFDAVRNVDGRPAHCGVRYVQASFSRAILDRMTALASLKQAMGRVLLPSKPVFMDGEVLWLKTERSVVTPLCRFSHSADQDDADANVSRYCSIIHVNRRMEFRFWNVFNHSVAERVCTRYIPISLLSRDFQEDRVENPLLAAAGIRRVLKQAEAAFH